MNCDSIRKHIPLYLYGEMSFEEEESFEQHLDGCGACRASVETEKRIQRQMDTAELRPSQELLERCRLELPRTMRKAGADLSAQSGFASWLRGVFTGGERGSPGWLKPAGAVALVALGFFAARWSGPQTGGTVAMIPDNEPVATQVRYVEPSESGQVRIVFDETRQREMQGTLEDENVRRMLLAAVRNPSDPGVRVESLGLLSDRSTSQDVRSALLFALENDPNDGVRLKALEGLRSYPPDAESRAVLSRVLLSDKNPGIRSTAVELLVQSREVDVVETLQELLRREDNNYVRMRGERALEEMNASLETF